MITALAIWWRRRRCWLRGYHVRDFWGVSKFRYDQPGMCCDCGKVGSGIPDDDGE